VKKPERSQPDKEGSNEGLSEARAGGLGVPRQKRWFIRTLKAGRYDDEHIEHRNT